MKYVRTEDGIYDVDFEDYNYVGKEFKRASWKTSQLVIKQADTIEELCDCFVYSDEVFKNVIYNNFHALKILLKLRKNYIVYGAIWTERGLIYVARMNEKGCLELL